MKLNLSDFKKVHEDSHTATLRHLKAGHEIKVAKPALSKSLKAEVASMPLHAADGTEIPLNLNMNALEDGKLQAPFAASQIQMPQAPEPPPLSDNPIDQSLINGVGTLGDMGEAFLTGGQGKFATTPTTMQAPPPKVPTDVFGRPLSEVLNDDQTAPQPTTQESGIGIERTGGAHSQMPTNPMTAGLDDYAGMMNKGYNEQLGGVYNEAKAQGELGRQRADAAVKQQANLQDLQSKVNAFTQHYQQDVASSIKDINDNQIKPEHYLENLGTLGKIKNGIGLIISGFGSGLTGQPNLAAQMLQNQIDRDINAQVTNLGSKENILKANLDHFKNMRDAMDMTRITQHEIYASMLDQAAAKATDPIAKARAAQQAGALRQQYAPILQGLAMRRAIMQQMGQGNADPAFAINFLAPEHEKAGLMKDLQSMQNMGKAKDNLLSAFDQVNKLNQPGNRLSNPIQSYQQITAIKEPLMAQLIKDSEGRITPQDAKMIEPLFPDIKDDAKTRMIKRQRLNAFVSEKMNFPSLVPYGISPAVAGRYTSQGRDRYAVGAPVAPAQTKPAVAGR